MKLKKYHLLLLSIFLICGNQILAQTSDPLMSNKTYNQFPLKSFIQEIQRDFNVNFIFKEEWIDKMTVSGNYAGRTLSQALTTIFNDNNLSVVIRGQNVVVYQKRNEVLSKLIEAEKAIDKNTIVIGDENAATTNDETVILSGFIKDGKTGDELYGASIGVAELGIGTVSNKYGFYRMEIPPGLYKITVKFVGFEESGFKVLLKNSGKFDVELYESSLLLDEVEVSEEGPQHNVTSTSISTTKLNIRAIKKLPAFLGEVDVVKSMLLLPGVTTVGEGASGFNVRGGSADQNLFLFDDAPVFNPSHLFGFFSNFNPDVVQEVTLYKGGIPAKYGDRISSVLDVQSKDGNIDKFGLKGGIGIVSSRLALEAPISNGKSSLIVGGRTSYSDWMLNRVKDIEIKQSSAQFYDANIKWNSEIGEHDKLSFSGYISDDQFKFAQDTSYNWTTRNLTAKWRHLFKQKLYVEVIGAIADYSYEVDGLKPSFTFNLKSGINYRSLGAKFTFIPRPNHEISYGAALDRYKFRPGDLTVDENSSVIPKLIEVEQANELSVYVQDEYKISNRLTVVAGMRYSKYDNVGNGDVIRYESGLPRNGGTAMDTVSFGNNETIASYAGFEPRLSMKYTLTNSSSVKLSYNRLRQYIHTISNTTAVTPIDIWKSSDSYLEPQIGDQIAVGFFKNLDDNNVETSVEVYYKNLDNIIDYKNGAEIVLNENIEQVLLAGIGRAYGIEFFLKKKSGRLTGWTSYTLSRTERKVDGLFPEEDINKGRYYPADYDQPHNLSVVANYQITKRWRMGFNFTYRTGRPTTAPEAKFTINGTELAFFSERNQHRIPDYHRLDFSVTLEGGHKRKKILDGNWTFSLYNVYGRRNAYSVFFQDPPGAPPGAYKLSVLGAIFPSLSYNFEL